MKKILNGIYLENPIFISALGLCSALAITTKFENAYMMGICVLTVLIISNFIVSLTRKIIPENVKMPVYILIVGTVVTIIEILLKKYIPLLHETFGIYLPLIIVNCVIIGRALTVASKENINESFTDAIGIGIGYTVSLMIIALIREIIGSNTITIMDSLSSLTGFKAVYTVIPANDIFPFSFLVTPAGAFLIIGLLMGIINYFVNKRRDNIESL